MPLRQARLSDLGIITSITAAAFHDEEVVGPVLHPHRQQYPEDYLAFWTRKIREQYWDYGTMFMISYYLTSSDPTSASSGEVCSSKKP